MGPNNTRAEFNETLSMLVTLYKDKKKDSYQEKNASLTVKLITATKVKSVGMVTVPLASYADRPALEEEL